MVSRNLRALLLAQAAIFVTTSPAWAQDAAATPSSPVGAAVAPAPDDRGLQDIVVTARKREESLMSVPVAVTAVSGAAVQRQGITDLNRLAQMAPQVVIARADSGTGASFTIRGLGSPNGDAGIEQSVTVAVDGVQLSRGNMINAGLFDLAQVEVLKGPQALFFGKNSPAGVISLTTANPTDKLSGYVRAGYETEAQEKYGEAAISGPITDTLKARLAVRGTTMRGWLQNVSQPLAPGQNPFLTKGSPGATHDYLPGTREAQGRLTLVWTPTDRFEATLKAAGGVYRDNGTSTEGYCYDNTSPASTSGGPVYLDPNNNCKYDNKIANTGLNPAYVVNFPDVHSDGKPYTSQNTFLNSLTLNYKLDDVTITSITSYARIDFSHANDYTFTTYGNLFVGIDEHTHSVSQEIRAVSSYDGPLNYTIGGFYEDIKRKNGVASFLFDTGPDPVTGKYHTFSITERNDAETLSAFGQLRYAILQTLELAAGVRYTHESRKQYTVNDYVNPIGGPLIGAVPQGVPFIGSLSNANWSPEVTLSWKPAPQTLFYGAYKTGYKSGGFSSPSIFQLGPGGALPTTADQGFRPETSKGGEIGFKGMLFNRRVRVEATAYRYDYSGLQLSIFNPATFSYSIRNAASARIQGIELSSDWRVTRDLQINADVAYNHARYVNFPEGQCYTGQPLAATPTPGFCTNNNQPLSGTPLVRAPDWTATGGFTYDRPLNDRFAIGLNADVNYSGKYITEEDANPLAVQHAFARVNAGIRVHTTDDRYEFAIIGRNLTNKYYIEASQGKPFGKADDFIAAVPRPREVRFQIGYKF